MKKISRPDVIYVCKKDFKEFNEARAEKIKKSGVGITSPELKKGSYVHVIPAYDMPFHEDAVYNLTGEVPISLGSYYVLPINYKATTILVTEEHLNTYFRQPLINLIQIWIYNWRLKRYYTKQNTKIPLPQLAGWDKKSFDKLVATDTVRAPNTSARPSTDSIFIDTRTKAEVKRGGK